MMKGNVTAVELETKLNEFWIDRDKDNVNYKQYAVLHKHEDGQVIDTSSSKDAARLVTIRTSKGDGRKVVFVIGCTEKALRLVSRCDGKPNINYESYFHVALTRVKEKMYFVLEKIMMIYIVDFQLMD